MSVFKLESAEVFAQAETRREEGQSLLEQVNDSLLSMNFFSRGHLHSAL